MRDQGRQLLRAANLSVLEQNALLVGLALLVAAVVAAAATSDATGLERTIGVAGLSALLLFGISRGTRAYHAGSAAALPTSVGRRSVRIPTARASTAMTIVIALVVPVGIGLVALVAVDVAWLPIAGVVLLGCGAMLTTWVRELRDPYDYRMESEEASELVRRLCMRADMPPSEVVVEHHVTATAWTKRGTIHLTSSLLELLDSRELEAVLAHEVAHLARRDAAAMEVCSGPSRVLLGFAGLARPLWRLTRTMIEVDGTVIAVFVWLAAAIVVPPAYALGWISRSSVLGMSRSREFAADAAAATLTGRPAPSPPHS